MAKKKRIKKMLLIGVPVVVVIAIIVMSLSGSNGKGTTVQAELAYVDRISEIVTASGRIHPQTKVDITSEVPAEIVAVYVSEGDGVARGKRLLLLDTVQYMSDVAQARFSVDEIEARTQAARSQYEKDKLEFERQSRLWEQNLSSETAYTNAKFAFENSQANYQAMVAQSKTARARLEKAEDNLGKTLIKSPMDGVVTFLSAEVGEIAQAQTSFTQGKTLMTVADLSVYEVEVDVDETEIASLRLGHPAGIRVDALRDTTFEGTVVEIGNSALVTGEGTENFTTSFRVKVRFNEAHASIRPGMSASVDITTATAEDALLIPYASLVTREFDPDSLKTDTTGKSEPDATRGGEVQAAEVDDADAPADSATAGRSDGNGKQRKDKVKKSGVFVVENGKVRFIEVATGIADKRYLEALSGVSPGDTVVSGSFQTLRKLSGGDLVVIDDSSLEEMKNE
ncbi:MAG: efflux RND transporter periplasmic adaptor subunit [Candidatus Zixiibacteriota bacterium]|nr:MAG: efflux RND transporter periplasmic adaptor subunit [candidate division Zixibacteria bacterium]